MRSQFISLLLLFFLLCSKHSDLGSSMKRDLNEVSAEFATESSEEDYETEDLALSEEWNTDAGDTEDQSDQLIETFIVKIRQLLVDGEIQQDSLYQIYKKIIFQLYGKQSELTPALLISGVRTVLWDNT